MNNNKVLVILGIVLGLVFLYVGYVYATHSAGTLPSYFPGYQARSSHVHTKHSIASFVLAAALFIYSWFQSGPKKTI
ncbi:MAG TPA: hypothetical protein VF974_05300 [Patescibacteria group bacterium]